MATEISFNDYQQQGQSPQERDEGSTGRISRPIGPGAYCRVSGHTVGQRSIPIEKDSDEDRIAGAVSSENKVSRRIACDVCRERKIRCDRSQPQCGRCSRLGHRCRYTASKKQDSSKLNVPQALLTLHTRLGKSPELLGHSLLRNIRARPFAAIIC